MLFDSEEETRSILRLGDHLVSAVGQKTRDACSQQSGVLGDHDPQRGLSDEIVHALSPVHPHGSSACTRVGPPAGLSIKRRPSSAATRSASPPSPAPVGSAPPLPSSSTST